MSNKEIRRGRALTKKEVIALLFPKSGIILVLLLIFPNPNLKEI